MVRTSNCIVEFMKRPYLTLICMQLNWGLIRHLAHSIMLLSARTVIWGPSLSPAYLFPQNTKGSDRSLLQTQAWLKPACLSDQARTDRSMWAEKSHNPLFPLETRLKIVDRQQKTRQEGRNGSINSSCPVSCSLVSLGRCQVTFRNPLKKHSFITYSLNWDRGNLDPVHLWVSQETKIRKKRKKISSECTHCISQRILFLFLIMPQTTCGLCTTYVAK